MSHSLGLFSFTRLIAVPLAHALGVKDKVRLRASHNSVLEKYYNTHSKHPSQVTPNTCYIYITYLIRFKNHLVYVMKISYIYGKEKFSEVLGF